MRGVPTIVSVRPGTCDLLPGLFGEIAPLPVPAHRTLAEAARVNAGDGGSVARDRLKLSPAQLAQALGVPRASRGTLAAVAFPQPPVDPAGLAVDRLSRAEATRRLLGARFGLRAGKGTPTLFERVAGASRAVRADEALIELDSPSRCHASRCESAQRCMRSRRRSSGSRGSPSSAIGVIDDQLTATIPLLPFYDVLYRAREVDATCAAGAARKTSSTSR